MTLSFVPLGVGDAFSALYYSSCLAVNYGDSWMLIDCPHPIRKMMAESKIRVKGQIFDINHIEGVALTHLHADHCSGLEGFAYACHFGLKKKARLLLHTRVLDKLWPAHLAAGMEILLGEDGVYRPQSLRDYFDITTFDEKNQAQFGPFEIRCRRTIHHIPTFGFLIRAGNKTLGYSADTSFDPEHIEWLSQADMIVHETNLGVHTPYEKLCALPLQLKSKMRLIHYTDQFDITNSEIEPLMQGIEYSL